MAESVESAKDVYASIRSFLLYDDKDMDDCPRAPCTIKIYGKNNKEYRVTATNNIHINAYEHDSFHNRPATQAFKLTYNKFFSLEPISIVVYCDNEWRRFFDMKTTVTFVSENYVPLEW